MSQDVIPALTPILGWPGYFLSRDGRLWSTRKPGGNEAFYDTPRLVKLQRRGDYWKVTLSNRGAKRQIHLHRLMLEVFVGPCPDGLEGCHNNGIHLDCRIDNLRWGTRKSNMQDKITHGTIARGSKHGMSKLTETLVLEIKARLKHGESPTVMAKSLGIGRKSICAIKHGYNWTWLCLPSDGT